MSSIYYIIATTLSFIGLFTIAAFHSYQLILCSKVLAHARKNAHCIYSGFAYEVLNAWTPYFWRHMVTFVVPLIISIALAIIPNFLSETLVFLITFVIGILSWLYLLFLCICIYWRKYKSYGPKIDSWVYDEEYQKCELYLSSRKLGIKLSICIVAIIAMIALYLI